MEAFNQDQILSPLNPQQREAVVEISKPLLVLAGAGSGKTRVITHKVAYLISQGFTPHNILALTFTKKAANEMKERIIRMLHNGQTSTLPTFIGTFHSFGAYILRRYAKAVGLNPNFTIYDEQDQLGLMKKIIKQANLPVNLTPSAVLGHIKKLKIAGMDPQDVELVYGDKSPIEKTISQLYKIYQRELKTLNAVDFTDLLLKLLELLKDNEPIRKTLQSQYKYILVDEYQDTNPPQYKIIKLLAEEHRNLCLVGDEDQSIYSWRGATVENIQRFMRDFPDHRIIKLERNYRSTQIILTAANKVIEKNPGRIGKNLWTDNTENIPIKLIKVPTPKEQALYIVQELQTLKTPLDDVAILYRVNAESRLIEEHLLRYGIPYRLIGGVRFYERMEVKDILAYLKFLSNPEDEISLLRIINTPPRGIGPKSIEDLRQIARSVHLGLSTFIYFAAYLYPYKELSELPEKRPLNISNKMAQAILDTRPRLHKYKRLLTSFADLIHSSLLNNITPAEMLRIIIVTTEYNKYLEKISSNEEELNSRKQNVQELINIAKTKQLTGPSSIVAFLEDIALIEEAKEQEGQTNSAKQGKVNLMTIHAAKGLEFDTVFIIDTIEGYIPHQRSQDTPQQLAEERRLFYVAITRTKRNLHIIVPSKILYMGEIADAQPSRFLDDIPADLVEYIILD